MITILYASSEQFAPILRVSLESLLQNKHPETFYQIYVMVETPYSDKVMALFSGLQERYTRFSIHWIIMGKQFIRTRTDGGGVGKESNYRLMAAEILPDADWCLYLDADTLVLKDLSDLCRLERKPYYILGLRPYYFLDIATSHYTQAHFNKFEQMICDVAGRLTYDQYIGAGVMIMNLTKLRADHMVEKFLARVPAYSGPLDQDILNACCYGHIGELSPAYCIDLNDISDLAWYQTYSAERYEQIRQAMAAPCIIHFSDRYKPWRCIGVDYEMTWWHYAFQTPAAEQLWKMLVQRSRTAIEDGKYERELNQLKNSLSYRLGRVLTWLPRKMFGIMKK